MASQKNFAIKNGLTVAGTEIISASGDITGSHFGTFSGTSTTRAAGTNNTQLATTAYVDVAITNLVDSSPGTLNTLNELAAALNDDAAFSTTVTNSIATKLPLAGGTLTGDLDIKGGATPLGVYRTLAIATDTQSEIVLGSQDLSNNYVDAVKIRGLLKANKTNGQLSFYTLASSSLTEAMRIDELQKVLIGKQSTALGTAGGELHADGRAFFTRNGGSALDVNRLSSDGTIASFYRDGSLSGTINSVVANRIAIRAGTTAGYLGVGTTDYFAWNTTDIRPTSANTLDLGVNGAEFRTLYLDTSLIASNDLTISTGTHLNLSPATNIRIGNNKPIWSGSYGGALFLKGNNATSDRYARICTVDSTGAAINNGLTVNNDGSTTIDCGQTYSLNVSGNGAGLRFSTGTNQRIYFNTHRAMEGNSDGSIIQVAEGYTQMLVQAREKFSVDGAIYGRVIIRFAATTSGDRLTAITANMNTLLGLSTGQYGTWQVEFGGYAGSGANGCTGSFNIGGYTGHNYAATNHNSYGAGTINVGYSSTGGASTGNGPLSYHPVINNGMHIANGEVWVYVPAAQQVGIMIKNNSSQGLYGTMTVTGTIRN